MWLKVVIVVLFVALLISLFTGLGFLIKNQGKDQQSRALWNALSVRLILAGLLLGCIFYGVFTGQLGSRAPWDARLANDPETATPAQIGQDQQSNE